MLAIQFSPDGTVTAMHNDKFTLGFLGKQEVRRATEITFNDDTQKWDIILMVYGEDGQPPRGHSDPAMAGFDRYEQARTIEVAWLNECRKASTDPSSPEGIAILNSLR